MIKMSRKKRKGDAGNGKEEEKGKLRRMMAMCSREKIWMGRVSRKEEKGEDGDGKENEKCER